MLHLPHRRFFKYSSVRTAAVDTLDLKKKMDNLGRSHFDPFWNKKNGRISEAFAECRCAIAEDSRLNCAWGDLRPLFIPLCQSSFSRHTDLLLGPDEKTFKQPVFALLHAARKNGRERRLVATA